MLDTKTKELLSCVSPMMTVSKHFLSHFHSLFCLHYTGIIFRFERATYTFTEDAGLQRDSIRVVKQQGNISEQTLTLLVDPVPFTAELGK